VTTFVLVHGAWLGGWVWRRVLLPLRSAGHDVYAPTLTGLGERAHLLHGDVGLDTHIRDVLGVLAFEDLTDVVLVGHSYSGAVITAVAEGSARRIARLVYVDGFLPHDGQSVFDLQPPTYREMFRTAARDGGDGWRIPATGALLDVWGVSDPDDRAWVGSNLTDFPLRCFEQAVSLPTSAAARIPCTYVSSTSYPAAAAFEPLVGHARAEGWDVSELPTGHVPMVSMPEELATVLCEAAAAVEQVAG
jgi:pimeloyl-ACP methyl ester carboxylesterase